MVVIYNTNPDSLVVAYNIVFLKSIFYTGYIPN